MTHSKFNQQPQAEVMELSAFDLEAVSGGGWFKKLTGISTPKFLRKIDKTVRTTVPGGWVTVASSVIGG